MENLSREERKALVDRYPNDEQIKVVLKRLAQAEHILDRSLYEFGAELRGEIEEFLGAPNLLARR
tara:strand:+ start:190 stop:384 length:195 start_codon:yes stop_codon:yes gene_type:complete